jgi:hypothetical protein
MLFSAIFKIPASAKGKILSADWIKLSIPLLPPLLQLQNITEIIIVRRFGSDIYLPVSAKLSKNTTLFFFRIFDVHKHWHFKSILNQRVSVGAAQRPRVFPYPFPITRSVQKPPNAVSQVF